MTDFRLICEDWNAEILAARRTHPGRVRIICPFIKASALSRILSAARIDDIEVITRFDLACFDQGVSDLDALERILDAGGKVRGVKGLHAKLFLFGEAVAIATSANVTDAAFHRNHEFGFVSTNPAIVATCEAYFDKLWKAAKPSLRAKQLADWRKRLAERRKAGDASAATVPLTDFGAEVDQSSPFAPPADAPPPQDNQGFIKFFGTARNRADRTVRVDDMIAENGANWACTYPESKPPRQVQDGDVIYMGRLVQNPNDLLIFGKALGRRHRDKEDRASKKEIAVRGWKADWPRYVRVHDGQFLDGTLADGISMSEMLRDLGADAFASTQRHARDQSGNTDPFASYGRKAHMLLTDESRAWIEDRLGAALRQHGEVDLTQDRFQPPA
ncbi:phospholipase D family protein [Sphingobium sp. TCM1]|uniref:phospholipase D family protein n=1 Tax=Sphingobium sp. TCM1 TaxID=453246 RepID=UPI0007F439A6|nr:phospholipase D family protein [Sphingobium sp. TCM1]OAN56834.1 hypothetical protein A7Q26_18095 [Sphingobium sp. TCM1]